MSLLPTPTVDVRAPDGGRVVLRPVVQLNRLPGISPATMAIVLALCAIFLATSVYRLNHTDLWGHLNFGRWIVQHGRLPDADPFRSLAAGESFLNVPWLSQVLGYATDRALGLEGLVLGHTLLVTLTAGLMILATCSRGVSAGWGAAAAVAGYLLALPVIGTIRPQLFGMAAFAATLWAIARLPARRDPLVWLPLVFVLWANLHGSFPMGLAALGCYAVATAWEAVCRRPGWRGAWSDRRLRRAWLALALATAASCLNPSGVKLLGAVAGFSGNNNLAGISEWRRLTIDSLSGVLLFGSLLLTAVLLRLSPRRIRACEVLLLLVFGLASLTAIRMLVWWALVWPWVAAPHAAAAWLRHRPAVADPSQPEPAPQQAAAWRALLAGACVFATLWWSPPSYALLTGRCRAGEAILSEGTPEGLAEQLVVGQVSGRLYAPMDWADYLIWRTGGAVEPMVYSHVHLTGEALWHDFLGIDSGSAAWREIADRYNLRYLVIDRARGGRLARRVAADPGCRVLASDAQGVLVEIAGGTRPSQNPTEGPRPYAGDVSEGERHTPSQRVGCSAGKTYGQCRVTPAKS